MYLLLLTPALVFFQIAALAPLSDAFATVGAMAAIVIVISELVDRFWKLDGLVSNIRALFIGVLLGMFGALLHLGMFADPTVLGEAGALSTWYFGGGLIGLEAGLVGNLLFLLPVVKGGLEWAKIRPKR